MCPLRHGLRARIGPFHLARESSMANVLLVRHLPRDITVKQLKKMFSKIGEVQEVSIPGQGRRRALVTMTHHYDIANAICALNRSELDNSGDHISVEEAELPIEDDEEDIEDMAEARREERRREDERARDLLGRPQRMEEEEEDDDDDKANDKANDNGSRESSDIGAQGSGKPVLTIAVIGAFQPGKSTLIAAIAKARAGQLRTLSVDEIRSQPLWRGGPGIAMAIACTEVETDTRRYLLLECGSHGDLVKAVCTGALRVDSAILVISPDATGASPALDSQLARDQLRLVVLAGARQILTFHNKTEYADFEENLELTEQELGVELGKAGFGEAGGGVIRGSARAALAGGDAAEAIARFMDACDKVLPAPDPMPRRPLLLGVDAVATTDRGTLVTGRIVRGTVAVGDEVEIVGLRETRRVAVTGVEIAGQAVPRGGPGDKVGIVLADTRRDDVEPGQVLARPRSITAESRLNADIYVATRTEGGNPGPIILSQKPQVHFWGLGIGGRIGLPEGVVTISNGDHGACVLQLDRKVALEAGLPFELRHDGRTIGAGVVRKA